MAFPPAAGDATPSLDFWTYLQASPPLLLDGAMGTELDRRAGLVEKRGWAAGALLTHPELVRAIHDDYVAAGADIHTTQTFSTARHVLENAGWAEHFESMNRTAVRLCREAITAAGDKRPRWIAGSISTYAEGSNRDKLPAAARLAGDFAEQAQLLANEGVDLLALEMLFDVETSQLALRAAAATGLPVMLGFTCRWSDDRRTVETRRGELSARGPLLLADALPAVLAAAPAGARLIVAIMHSDFDVTDATLDIVQAHWDGPVALYPNSGVYLVPHWQFDTVCAPEVFAGVAAGWAARRAHIIGGCCGLGPAHLGAARTKLDLDPSRPTASGKAATPSCHRPV